MHTKIQKEKLWMSVQHYLENWQDIATANIGSATCACCAKWAGNDCVGCPIRQHTGKHDCEDTPWHAAYDVMVRDWSASTTQVQDAIEEEYRFLVELVLEPYADQAEGDAQ